MFEDNLEQLKSRVEAMIAADRTPLVFLDLDETLNRRFGTTIEKQVVNSLRNLDMAGGLFGLNTGANIFWAGERILSETDRFFPFPFMLLAIGQQIYAWVEALQAYILLPIQAEDKGQAIRILAEYLALPPDQCIFVADFPGEGDRQEGIDDPVLKEQVGAIVNVGRQRDVISVWKEPLILNPERSSNRLVGVGFEATTQYLECITEVLHDERYTTRVKTLRSQVMLAVENKLNLPFLSERESRVWTFEHPIYELEENQAALIRVKGSGIVHAGVNHDGKWIRIYGVPLKEVSPGNWEAYILDPEVNEFTFIWYDPKGDGNVRWEGKNYSLQRLARVGNR